MELDLSFLRKNTDRGVSERGVLGEGLNLRDKILIYVTRGFIVKCCSGILLVTSYLEGSAPQDMQHSN